MTAKTAREMLDLIDDFFTDMSIPVDESRKLWDVLSALRGPDEIHRVDSTPNQKATATIPIRRAAFPKVAAAYLNSDMWERIGGAFGTINHKFDSRFIGQGHFREHAVNAATALNLISE